MLTYVGNIKGEVTNEPGEPRLLAFKRAKTPVQSLAGLSGQSVDTAETYAGGADWDINFARMQRRSDRSWAGSHGLGLTFFVELTKAYPHYVPQIYARLHSPTELHGGEQRILSFHRWVPEAPKSDVGITETIPLGGAGWVRVIRDLIEREMILQARSILAKVPPEIQTDEQFVVLKNALELPRAAKSEMERVHRNQEFAWLRAHEEEYRGKWVAVVENQLVSAATSLDGLVDDLKRLALPRRPLVYRFPD